MGYGFGPGEDQTVRLLIGDARDVLATMPENSVDLVLTSPPFLALRSYLAPDHPDKQLEIGSEATPGEFIDSLLDVVEACERVTTPHASLCFELGDTYSGSGGAGGDYNEDGLREGQQKFSGSAAKRAKNGVGDDYRPSRAGRIGWPGDRSLCLIPELFRISLVYGFNPLTGRLTATWRARNVVRWCRPNPTVGALGDKFRPATSDMVVVCKDRRWFDLDAVRTEPKTEDDRRFTYAADAVTAGNGKERGGQRAWRATNEGGVPPLDWWKLPTAAYPGAHYAVWPDKLCETPIESMCPRRVCLHCGVPSVRLTEHSEHSERYAEMRKSVGDFNERAKDRSQGGSGSRAKQMGTMTHAENVTIGWSCCGCGGCKGTVIMVDPESGIPRDNNCDVPHWRRGVVLDPFAGSGTTLMVAHGHGRSSIGIDLDGKNESLVRDRLGMFLEVGESV